MSTPSTPKRGFFGKIKDIFSELGKVSWPTFRKVIKQTGIVIAVVLFFLLVMLGIDALFGLLFGLLKSGLV